LLRAVAVILTLNSTGFIALMSNMSEDLVGKNAQMVMEKSDDHD